MVPISSFVDDPLFTMLPSLLNPGKPSAEPARPAAGLTTRFSGFTSKRLKGGCRIVPPQPQLQLQPQRLRLQHHDNKIETIIIIIIVIVIVITISKYDIRQHIDTDDSQHYSCNSHNHLHNRGGFHNRCFMSLGSSISSGHWTKYKTGTISKAIRSFPKSWRYPQIIQVIRPFIGIENGNLWWLGNSQF